MKGSDTLVSRGRNAKKKGSRYELTMAKRLQKLTGYVFQRTAYSGAQSSDTLTDRTFVGDLFAEENSGFDHFNYELKSHDNFTLRNLVLGNGELPSYLRQCLTDTKLNNNTLPCLILNIKGFYNVVLLPYNSRLFTILDDLDNKLLFSKLFRYKDERLGSEFCYHMIVTDVDTFGKLTKKQLEDYYKNTINNFDVLNLGVEMNKGNGLEEFVGGK